MTKPRNLSSGNGMSAVGNEETLSAEAFAELGGDSRLREEEQPDIGERPEYENETLTSEAFAELSEESRLSFVVGGKGAEGDLIGGASVPWQKPGSPYFRIHPGRDFELIVPVTYALEDRRKEHAFVLVNRSYRYLSPRRVSIVRLMLCQRLKGECFLWGPSWHDIGQQPTEYQRAISRIVAAARKYWLYVEWNGEDAFKGYKWPKRMGPPPAEPLWPEYSFQEILTASLRGRIISGPDHPVIMARGEEIGDEEEEG